MGDSGSLFLGFTLAALAIAQAPRASNLIAILGVPILIFLLPILDTTMVTVTRILRGQSPAQGGRDHTSHRLIAFGLSERQTVLALYGVALVSGILGTLVESLDYAVSLLLIPVLLIVFTLLTAYLARIKVVESSTPVHPGRITRLMIGLTGRGRILEIALDFLIISVAYYLAFWLYFGFDADILGMEIFVRALPLAFASAYAAFFIFGIYSRVWQYIGLRDLPRFFGAALGAGILLGVGAHFLFPGQYPLSILFLFGIFIFLGLATSRASFRLLDQVYTQRHATPPDQAADVLIFGAGDQGVLALEWLGNQPQNAFRVVGFLDSDPFKRGRQIQGVPVLGGLDELETILDRHPAQGIILPSEAQSRKFQQSATGVEICRKRGIWIKQMEIRLEEIP
jgi:UDP-GlcNAc:undecaprenyl-phosphate GlcNAc-1-phosphate transferase